MAGSQSKAAEIGAILASFLMLVSAGLSYAQRLDGPEIAVDCDRGPNILRLCRSGCRAEAEFQRDRRVNNEERMRRLAQCLGGCWGISRAMEECSPRR